MALVHADHSDSLVRFVGPPALHVGVGSVPMRAVEDAETKRGELASTGGLKMMIMQDIQVQTAIRDI